ncbi:hypothetical protein C900_02992 [Fulvivirga imtechensis AK7]|uniref:Uncharacterized protein n=1 Tax=Fulvivirga imtechensis AK7 TaxID=1237149 RepID=L8JSL2_9BACT|nr:hypothetical protein [Fulvivirga imtechensis]ELR71188.1 hypothetical protein C900_02992 [Fulvivirga imtechensis AK7]
MKDLIAKEFLYFFVAVIVALPVGFLFLYLVHVEPAGATLSEDEKVLEMDLLFIGGLLGFIGVYLVRLTVWAVKQLLVSK